MALQSVISQLSHFGIPATVEEAGGWHHSAEYLALRYGGTGRLLKVLEAKIEQGDRRALLQYALVKNDPSVLCEAPEEEQEEE